MRQKFALVFVTLLLLIVPLSFVSAQGDHAKWTVMVYMAANNNLEPNSIINLMEMAAVGSTKDVNIVVQVTRPPDYKGFYGEWGGTRRFLVTKSDGQLSSGDFQISPTRFNDYLTAFAEKAGISSDAVAKVTRGTPVDREVVAMQLTVPSIETETPLTPLQLTNLEDMGDKVNSGDGATLADFGTWAAQNYPADHYGLVMWDHGGGWSMIASDDTQSPGGITMPAFQSALTTITQATNQKFDFIGFDACLMSQLAVTAIVAPFADYEIGAEELVPGFGWDYTKPLSELVANPDLPVTDFAKATIDSFDTLYSTTEKDAAQSFDMGLTDLSKIGGVIGALDAFNTAVKASPDELGPISTARSNAQIFGSVGEDADTTAAISSVDLADFMRLMGSLSKDDSVKQAANGVIDAVGQMVLYHKASKSLPHANGLSVYFPENANTFALGDGARYTTEFGTYLPTWQTFLDSLYNTASAASSSLNLKISAVTTSTDAPGSIHDTPVISYSLDGQNIVGLTANIIYRIDDKTSVVLDSFPVTSDVTTEDGSQVNDYPDGQSSNDFYWNTRIPSLSDGTNSLLVLMTTNAKDEQHGFVQGTYTNQVTGAQNNASLLINLDTYESSGLWVSSGADANSPIAQVFPKAGDTFEPNYLVLDDKGNAALQASGTVLTFGKDPLQVTDAPGPDGQYTVALIATDAAGTQTADSATVDVKNAGLDASLQGFKDLGFGLAFLYPGDWTDVSVYQREDGLDELYVTDINGEDYLSAIDFNDVTSLDETQKKVEDEINGIVGVTVGDTADEQVGEFPGKSLSYQYTNADGVLTDGFAVAVYVENTQQGYMLTLEMPHDASDQLNSILDGVLQSAAFFAPDAWMFFALAGCAEVGLFLSTAPINAIMLRTAPVYLRASAMAAAIFAIHLFGDLWSPYLLGALLDVVAATAAMMALPLTFALSAYVWWPRRAEAE